MVASSDTRGPRKEKKKMLKTKEKRERQRKRGSDWVAIHHPHDLVVLINPVAVELAFEGTLEMLHMASQV